MCKKTESLKSNIINFLNDDAVIDYLNEIHNYGLLLAKIAKKQDLKTREIQIDDPEIIAEYDFHREKIKDTFDSLRLSLLKYGLEKEVFKPFCNEQGHVKAKFGHIADLINLAKFFVAIIRNHKDDKLTMTLGERIRNLMEIKSSEKYMLIAELTSLKDHSRILEEKVEQPN